MKRLVVRHKETGKYLNKTGKYSEWVDWDKAEMYHREPSKFVLSMLSTDPSEVEVIPIRIKEPRK